MIARPWRWPVATQILVSLLIGVTLGWVAAGLASTPEGATTLQGWLAQVVQPAGRLFIRLIFMVVVPLVFSAVILGVAEMGGARQLGRIGLRAAVVTLGLTLASVAIGLGLVARLHPGRDLAPQTRQALVAQYGGTVTAKVAAAKPRPLADTLVDLVPQNPLAEAAAAFNPGYPGGGLVGVMVFALFFGSAVVLLPRERTAPLLGFVQGVYDASMVVIGFAMRLAPLGVACLGFALTATTGTDTLRQVAAYVGVCLLGCAIHQFGVYGLVLWLAERRPPFRFFAQVREAMVTALATASSNATLPVTLRVADDRLKLPRRVSRFVLTVGSTANHCGTALYVAVTVGFLAQVFGVTLDAGQLVFVALMSVLAGVGTAGVPGGVIPLLVAILAAIGVPGEGVAIVLGVDRLLDMARTTLNVTGNLVSAVLVARGDVADAS